MRLSPCSFGFGVYGVQSLGMVLGFRAFKLLLQRGVAYWVLGFRFVGLRSRVQGFGGFRTLRLRL